MMQQILDANRARVTTDLALMMCLRLGLSTISPIHLREIDAGKGPL
jgi:hypothetical protein